MASLGAVGGLLGLHATGNSGFMAPKKRTKKERDGGRTGLWGASWWGQKKWWQHRSQKSGATASLWPTLSASQFLGSSLLRYPPPLSWRRPVLYPAKTVPLHTMPWAFILYPGATQTSGLMAFYSKTLRQIELWEHEQRGRSRWWCRGRATQKEEKEQAVVAGHKGNNAMPWSGQRMAAPNSPSGYAWQGLLWKPHPQTNLWHSESRHAPSWWATEVERKSWSSLMKGLLLWRWRTYPRTRILTCSSLLCYPLFALLILAHLWKFYQKGLPISCSTAPWPCLWSHRKGHFLKPGRQKFAGSFIYCQYFAILPKNKILSWTIINLAAAPLAAMPPAVKKSAVPSVFQEGKQSYILYTWTKNYLCPMLLKYQPCFSYTNVCIVFFVLNNTDAVRISHSMATVSSSPSGNYTGQCAICVNDGWLAGFQPSINGSIPKYFFFCGGLQQIILRKKPPLGGTKEKGLLRQAKILIQTKRNSSGVLQ